MISKKLLQEATKRLVSNFQPERIILFGSYARGTADEHSDADILVVCPVKKNRIKAMVEMDSVLDGLKLARDIVVLTPKEWLVHADEDLRLAKHAFKLKSSCPYKLIAYHAQQCAEKYLKAYLIFRNIDFPYTHNISHLLELCPDLTVQAKDLNEAKVLTPYAITARYPGKGKVIKRDALYSQ